MISCKVACIKLSIFSDISKIITILIIRIIEKIKVPINFFKMYLSIVLRNMGAKVAD